MADLNIHIRINPSLFRVGLVGLFLGVFISDLGSESVTLSTYYPAPSGVYTNMSTTGETRLARNNGQVAIGSENLTDRRTLRINGIMTVAVRGSDPSLPLPISGVTGGSIYYNTMLKKLRLFTNSGPITGSWRNISPTMLRGNAQGYLAKSQCPDPTDKLVITWCNTYQRCTDFGDWLGCDGWTQSYVDLGCTVAGAGPNPANRTQPPPTGICFP